MMRRLRLVVTTDGQHLHMVRVLVPDHDAGRDLSASVTSGLQVRSWTMPS